MNRRLRSMLTALCGMLLGLAAVGWLILGQAKFGKAPEGERLDRIRASSNYKNGQFVNTVPTPTLIEGESTLRIMWKNLFADKTGLRPSAVLPTVKTDLKSLDRATDTVIWLGHSSYFIQIGGKRILVDPVFSGYGAPFSFLNTAFDGTSLYTAADMPDVDILLISHDHWDHLDYQSAVDMLLKTGAVVVPLGVGAHFEHWGYPLGKIHEADWNAALPFDGVTVHVVPARHYSSRAFDRNQTLWAGFVLETADRRMFLSGDTGYGPHFADIAKRFEGFDLAMLDGGQYDPRWPYIHMTPEEAATAAKDLGAKTLLLSHAGRFSIARHTWNDPFQRIAKAAEGMPYRLLTPRIGEPVRPGDREQRFSPWWQDVSVN